MLRQVKNLIPIFTLAACLSLSAAEGEKASFKPKDYSSLLGKIKGLSDNLLKMHFTLYEGYVKNTNALITAIGDMENNNQDRTLAFMALQRRFGWEYDGMRLHELYFENLGQSNPLAISSDLYKQIVSDFKSFDNWKKEFLSMGLIRGIGWVILYKDPIQNRLFNVWVNEHDLGHLAGGTPLLVMDVWEHAYITEYGLDRARYIDMFMQNINWDAVMKRFIK